MNQQQIRQRTHVSVCRDCTRAKVREQLCEVGRQFYLDTLTSEAARYDLDSYDDPRPFTENPWRELFDAELARGKRA